jgi:hypothetical protein
MIAKIIKLLYKFCTTLTTFFFMINHYICLERERIKTLIIHNNNTTSRHIGVGPIPMCLGIVLLLCTKSARITHCLGKALCTTTHMGETHLNPTYVSMLCITCCASISSLFVFLHVSHKYSKVDLKNKK